MLRVYNLHGRRDNIYKARIKILVNAIGVDEYRRQVEEEWERIRERGASICPPMRSSASARHFAPPELACQARRQYRTAEERAPRRRGFDRWVRHNVSPHQNPGPRHRLGRASRSPAARPAMRPPSEMQRVADAADRYSRGEVRVTYTQNLILPNVARADLVDLYEDSEVRPALSPATRISSPTSSPAPGLDYCNLGQRPLIPIAQAITERFADPERAEAIGELRLNISGCINACGHHHAGHIGILGVDKKGTEHYQITLGGSPRDDAAIGDIVGPSFPGRRRTRCHRNNRRHLSGPAHRG